MYIEVQNLIKRYDKTLAVDDVSFNVSSGKILALLGPSGCGKTSVLRMIAGLIKADSGKILLDSKDVSSLLANQRPTVTVFQDYALFPHLNVYENIAYGLKARNIRRKEIIKRVNDLAEMVQIKDLVYRKTHQLSGGQQQRVALARALVLNPEIILFDEPLSSLDANLRIEMRHEIIKIQERTGITSIYVTHDQEEALSMSDKIVVMNHGKIEQIGKPQELYTNPQTTFVAKFMGDSNMIPISQFDIKDNKTLIKILGNQLLVHTNSILKEDEQPYLFCRPENIIPDENGMFSGVINKKLYLGNTIKYFINTNGAKNDISMTLSPESKQYVKGQKICFNIRCAENEGSMSPAH